MSEPEVQRDQDRHTGRQRLFGRWAGLVSRAVLLVCVVAMVATGAFFFRFLGEIGELQAAKTVPPADGIVVLTGDGQRIRAALSLLETGKGKRLLISGVHAGTSATAIRNAVQGRKESFDCCVDIDKAAQDTIGNAEQAGEWAQRNGFETLIVVTSDYHMPRSLLELRNGAPNIRFAPYPVITAASSKASLLSDSRTLRRLVPEFAKYLAARIRLSLGDSNQRTAIASVFSH